MFETLLNTPLFEGMTVEDIEKCFQCSEANCKKFETGEIIFRQEDIPKYMYVLLSGSVSINRSLYSGKEVLMHTIKRSGDIFGEVYIFLSDEKPYNMYTEALGISEILFIPKDFFFSTCDKSCGHHNRLIRNMLGILANKTYIINKKNQILQSGSLRNKLAHMIYYEAQEKKTLTIEIPSREEMSKYLGVARPSVSREILSMQDDGILGLDGNMCKIIKIEELELLL